MRTQWARCFRVQLQINEHRCVPPTIGFKVGLPGNVFLQPFESFVPAFLRTLGQNKPPAIVANPRSAITTQWDNCEESPSTHGTSAMKV